MTIMNQELPIHFKDKKVALLGFGVENRAMLPYLQRQGAKVTICDQNEILTELPAGIPTQLGKNYLKSLADFDVIFRSPGIPYLKRELQEAKLSGVILTSQTEFFLARVRDRTIGVTGTKGKGTTASLIHAILLAAKARGELAGQVEVGGNIGKPPITFTDSLGEEDWVVLELSSFQLQGLTVSPHIAVVLNVSVDHLDYHKDEAEYIAAKKNIVHYQKPGDFLVINLDSLLSPTFAEATVAETYFYSREKSVDQGAFVERRVGDDAIVLRLPGKGDKEIGKVAEVKLVGAYNLENITAAASAAALVGVSEASIRSGIMNFSGLPHRLQFVAEVGGIRYFDDSNATTPEATIGAVLSFASPITLIVGGVGKGADYSELVKVVAGSSVATVICIGQEGAKLRQLFANLGAKQTVLEGKGTMAEIVAQAARVSQAGSVVLLSPAAASFDMFANASDRGEQFQEAVKALNSSGLNSANLEKKKDVRST